jgi:hypothetical protein
MRFPDDLPTKEEAAAAWDSIAEKENSALRSIASLRSIDFLLLLISGAVSGIVAVPALVRLLSKLQPPPKPVVSWFLMIVLWTLVCVGTAGIAGGRVRSFPCYAWMFRGLMDSPEEQEGASAQL